MYFAATRANFKRLGMFSRELGFHVEYLLTMRVISSIALSSTKYAGASSPEIVTGTRNINLTDTN